MSRVRYFVSWGKSKPVETAAESLAGAKVAAERRREDPESDLYVWKEGPNGKPHKIAAKVVNMQKRGWPREWHDIGDE